MMASQLNKSRFLVRGYRHDKPILLSFSPRCRTTLTSAVRPGHGARRHFFVASIDDPILSSTIKLRPDHTGHHRCIRNLQGP